MTKILGLSGKASSGKSTLSRWLIRNQQELMSPWSYGKVERYSPSDLSKALAVDLFGLRPEQVWGDEEQKQTLTEYVGEAFGVPVHEGQAHGDGRQRLTAREFLEGWGDLIVETNYRAPIRYVLNQVKKENPYLAVIDNVRRPVEVEEIHRAGGKVIRLTQNPNRGTSTWETALDSFTEFDAVIDNEHQTRQETVHELLTTLQTWDWIKPLNRSLPV